MLKLTVISLTYFLFCGIHGIEAQERILGGKNAVLGEFPYALSIRTIRDYVHICTGVIILRHWALTDAHCVAEPERKPHQLVIMSDGISDRVSEGVPHYAKQIVIHKDFKKDPEHNDLAVIEVREPFFDILSSVFQVEPKDVLFGSVEYGDNVEAVGWSIKKKLLNSENLKFANAEVIYTGDDDCKKGSPLFCIKFGKGEKVTAGDIGGPVVKKDEKHLVGILTSGKGNVQKVTRIQYFKKWLNEVTGCVFALIVKWK